MTEVRGAEGTGVCFCYQERVELIMPFSGLFSGDEGSLSSILEHLANIARLRYDESSAFISSVFEVLAREYQNAIKAASSGIVSKDMKTRLDVVEGI